MRVLAIIDDWEPTKGGVVVVNRRLCEGLAQAGHEVYCRLDVPPGSSMDLGVHLIGPTDGDTPEAIEVIIGHSRFSGEAAYQYRNSRYPQAQMVHFVHMVTRELGIVQNKPEKGLQNREIEKRLVKQADLAVGVGPVLGAEAEALASEGLSAGEHRPGVHVLIPGVPFSEPPAIEVGGREHFNLLLLGRADDEQKGTMQAARMVAELRRRAIDARLTVRGADPANVQRATMLLSNLAGRAVNVKPYTNRPEDLQDDVRQADMVLMPSRAEGFGLVGFDALGAGVPVMVPSSSGIGRFLTDATAVPHELGQQFVVDQGFVDQVPVEKWAERLASAWSNLDGVRQSARQLRQHLQNTARTWKGAGELLMSAVQALPARPSPARGKARTLSAGQEQGNRQAAVRRTEDSFKELRERQMRERASQSAEPAQAASETPEVDLGQSQDPGLDR